MRCHVGFLLAQYSPSTRFSKRSFMELVECELSVYRDNHLLHTLKLKLDMSCRCGEIRLEKPTELKDSIRGPLETAAAGFSNRSLRHPIVLFLRP